MPVHRLISIVFGFGLLLIAPSIVCAAEIHDLLIHNDETNALSLLKKDLTLVTDRDASQCTPLHYAAEYSETNVVKWLLKHKAPVNAIAFSGFTPLHLTSDPEIAHLLLKAGADLKIRDAFGRTPLQRAALLQHTNVCDEMLKHGSLDLNTALWLGRREEAIKLIKRHPKAVQFVEPDSDKWGNTSPLGIAAGNGDVEIVRLLLAAGAPVNAATDRPDIGPMTPLCNAVWGGHYEIAKILCDAGADCNVTGGKFCPRLLDFAIKYSGPDMVALLTAHGAVSGK